MYFVIIYLAARNPEGGGTDLALAVIISSSVESYPLELSEKINYNRLIIFLESNPIEQAVLVPKSL